MEKIKISVVGLDTSHSVALPKLIQDPTIPVEKRNADLIVTRCLRFETPFQNKKGLDERQEYLESIGVTVTEDFDIATGDCDAIMIAINDPARHLEYFEKCVKLGKPIFLDKPMADSLENSAKIIQLARENNIRFFTASALRFDVDFNEALSKNVKPASAIIWGPVGQAPAGSSIVWYGVHAFEMVQRIMGCGAHTVNVSTDSNGYVCHVNYDDGRRGVAELFRNCWNYGGMIKDAVKEELHFRVSGRISFYKMLLDEVARFFKNGDQIVPIEDSFEVMALLSAADRSAATGKPEKVYSISDFIK